MKKRVAVALSGGVDSLVAAYLLKKEYPEMFGIHFRTGYEQVEQKGLLSGEDSGTDGSNNLDSIAKQLDIEIHCIDLKEEFNRDVVSYFVETYLDGKTPNPCLICNKKIKFGALLDAARSFGADMLATGHYAKIIHHDTDNSGIFPYTDQKDGEKKESLCRTYGELKLVKGKDPLKDQSYFLSMLTQEQIAHAIFPLGDLTKKKVKEIAAEAGLKPVEKKESQDICFINEGSFADFITSKCSHNFSSGEIVTTDGKVAGTHNGLYRYTIGQRRGLNCPGPAPYYVKEIDMSSNRLIIGFKNELYSNSIKVREVNWLCEPDCEQIFSNQGLSDQELSTHRLSTQVLSMRLVTKIRYSHPGAESTIFLSKGSNRLEVIFDEPQLSVTPGQAAVFYLGDRVMGAGFIE